MCLCLCLDGPGDEWDSIVVEKPPQVPAPPEFESKRRTTLEDFRRMSTEINQETQTVHSHMCTFCLHTAASERRRRQSSRYSLSTSLWCKRLPRAGP